jgi:hypothetical protein
MADKKVILEVELIEGNANSKLNELKASLKSLDKTHKDYKPTLQLVAQAERDLVKAQQKRILVEKGLADSTVKVEKATKKTAKQMKQLSSDTGASTSATLELGRVFSDAPYGIRGVANNIQQLASNLFFMSKKTNEATGKTVGFKGAIGSLLKNLIGPAGILVAFQAGVALLDYLSANTDKATNSVSELKEEFNDLASAMSSNANVSVEKYIELLKDKQFLEKEVTKSTEKLKTIEEELAGIRFSRARTNDFEKRQELNRKEKVFLEQIEQVYRDTATAINVYNDKKKQLNAAEEGTVRALEKQKSELIANQKTISNTSKIWKEEAEKIKKIQAEIDAITGGKKKRVGSKKKRDKAGVLGLDSIDIGETKKKMKKVLDAVADAVGIDLKKDPLKIDTNLDLELSDEAKKMVSDKLKSDLDNLMLDSKLEDAKEFIDKSKAVLGAMTDFVNAEFERELTIEQNKTSALNTELNNRLNNENLSKEQRASIQNQIAQNDEKLRVKQDAIEKKKFKMNKAARIANALMDTASAAIGVMADSKGDFLARLTNAIPTIAFGLAQVAAISRQKFKSSASKTPISTTGGGGSSGGGAARAEPSFNIVGRSNNNQLLNAIQSQFDKPLKAYVVSGEVTNQQELDRNISSGASF